MSTAADIIRAHIPNLTTAAEAVIDDRIERNLSRRDFLSSLGPDYADYAVRICPCGKQLDGFYEYADHLIELLEAAKA